MYGIRSSSFLLVLVLLLSGTCHSSHAANHALLVGIGAYSHLPARAQLEGPGHDIFALRQMLIGRYGFHPEAVTILVDRDAGKQAILDAFDGLIDATQPGDFVFIYFSGHGTSAQDEDNVWAMSPHTGALLPADFNPTVPEAALLDQLLIGSRDLRPHLQRLERDRSILVCIDACHSGLTVRGSPRQQGFGYRYFELSGQTGPPRNHFIRSPTAGPIEYPYVNTSYIAAAASFEKAIDITSVLISKGWLTYDGKPYGAFSDALLHVLSGTADADGDGGSLSIGELYSSFRNKVTTLYELLCGHVKTLVEMASKEVYEGKR